MQRSKTTKSRNNSESKNTSSSKKTRRSSRRKKAAVSEGASLSTASPVSDPAGSGSSAADVSASGVPVPASSSVSVSAKEAAVSDDSGFFGFNPSETSGLDDYENIPLDPSNLDLWFLQDTSPLAAGSETGPGPSLFEEEKPAPVPTDDSSGDREQEKADMPEPEPEDDSAETYVSGPVSQSREPASGSIENVPGDFDKSDFKYTPDDQLEKAVQNHENDPAPDSADGFSDNTFRKKTDTTAAVLAGGYASVSSRRRSDATEAASKGSSASVSSRRRSDTTAAAFEGSSANVSSRRRSDATEAASEASSAGVSSRRRSDTTAAALAGGYASTSSRRSDTTAVPSSVSDSASAAGNDSVSVSRRPRAESRAVDSHPASAPLNRSPEQVPEHSIDSDVSYDHSGFREGESLSDDRPPLFLVLIKILFTLIGIIFCLMIVTYFRARLAGEVPDLGILTQLLEKHQKEVEITGSMDESPNMGPGFDITTGFYGKSIDLFNQSDSAEDNSADTAGQDQAEQPESEDQSSADPAAGNGENSRTQSDGQDAQAAPQETTLPETVQQNPVIDNGAADPNTVQQGTGYDNGSGDQTVIDPAGTVPQTEGTYYDESGQPAAFPEQTYENGTGDGQGTVVEETIVEEDDGGDLDGYYEEGDGYYDDDGYYYEEVPEDEEGEYYEEDEDYYEDEDE